MPAKIQRAFVFSIAACAIVLAGCSHETQQQKFMDAMSHGNSAQASQIWLHMDAKSRADFSHSEGMQPNTSPDDVKKQVMQHYQDEADKGDDSGKRTTAGKRSKSRRPTSILAGSRVCPSGSDRLASRRSR